jgi:hypothetical protein
MKTQKTYNPVTPSMGAHPIPKEKVRELFLASLPNAPEGGNSIVSGFMFLADKFLATRQTFTLSEFLYEAHNHGIGEVNQIKKLFNNWTNTLAAHCRLEIVQGCYDELVFCQI